MLVIQSAMELTEQQQHDIVNRIAEENPSILMKALQNNGFWLYALSKFDIQSDIIDGMYTGDTSITPPALPITDEDMNYVNRYSEPSDFVDYSEAARGIVNLINSKRYRDTFTDENS
jgi:peptidoglycan hydrolase-like amidase